MYALPVRFPVSSSPPAAARAADQLCNSGRPSTLHSRISYSRFSSAVLLFTRRDRRQEDLRLTIRLELPQARAVPSPSCFMNLRIRMAHVIWSLQLAPSEGE